MESLVTKERPGGAWSPRRKPWRYCTYVDFDLGARAAGVGGTDGLVGGEDPHAADAAGPLVPLVERHVVGLLHHELRLAQPDTAEAGGKVAR